MLSKCAARKFGIPVVEDLQQNAGGNHCADPDIAISVGKGG